MQGGDTMTPTAHVLVFSVPGVPCPQGSKRAFIIKGKDGKLHAPMIESSKGVKPWRALISLAARDAMREQGCVGWFKKEPVNLALFFYFSRPKSLSKKQKHHVVRPDLDKLCRAVLDAMKGIVYGDDGQVGSILANKGYGTNEMQVEVREPMGYA